MKKTIAMMMALVASATFAGCADMNTKITSAGNTPATGGQAGASQACKADAGQDDALVGMTEADAAAQLDGCLWRVLERDGNALPGTMDYRQERRNLGIRDGKVIWVRRG
ncbi:hypothetical protein [Burkholderia sp. S-53]|uniref:hypothetical protein n=1 Tax=Burkholderia sp. S-53 TaxID=2906514 RepID=UPI0021CF007C|nr:hypothetical protein [Burkholderia sp. S-53]UXU89125.1 hypothetical protein LXM88_11910 [Burkholderia sp. S-53]